MRITYFMNFYPTESQIVAEAEMLEMIRLGHDVYVLPIWGAWASDPKIPVALKDRVLRFPVGLESADYVIKILRGFLRSPHRHVRFIRKALSYLGIKHTLGSIPVIETLRRLSLDRIHAHFASNAALRAMLISEALSISYSCTGHGSDILLYPDPHLPEIIKNARPFITISEYNKRRLIELTGCTDQDIQVVYCGVDLERFVPVKHEPNIAAVLLSVTWLREVKGVEYLIEACRILKEKGMIFRCIIVGGGERRGKIEKTIEEYHLRDIVVLKGALMHSEVIALYGKADVFALPSLSEGIPVSLMEAMAMELPVIATRITGIPELVTDGESGFLVEPKDPVGIADRVEKILSDPELGRYMGKKAREKVKRGFDLRKNVKSLEQLFLQTQERA